MKALFFTMIISEVGSKNLGWLDIIGREIWYSVGAMPRILPEPRWRSMDLDRRGWGRPEERRPELGGRGCDLVVQLPVAWPNSPAAIVAAWLMTVTR